MSRSLSAEELAVHLDSWRGSPVAVRVVTAGGNLVAVAAGRLEARTDARSPAWFWPLSGGPGAGAEQPGIYVHRDVLTEALLHEGEFVVEFWHEGVEVNVRVLRPIGASELR